MISLENYQVSGASGELLVDQLSFQLKPGEALGIVGESGSGKSLSALGIFGLVPSSKLSYSGQLTLLNQQIIVGSPDWRNTCRQYFGREIGFIFQDPMSSLHPTKKCIYQIREAIHSPDKKLNWKVELSNMLEKVGLSMELAKKYPFQLSGGQQQRIMIAMALINEPKLIIADEPNTALDADTSKEIGRLIKALCRELNASLVVVSHDLHFVEELSDQILVLNSGKTMECGLAKEVFKEPKSLYTKELLASKPEASKKGHFLSEVGNSKDQNQEVIPSTIEESSALETLLLNPVYGKDKKLYQPLKQPISFTLKKGAVLGLVGASGSGKSSIAKSLVGWVDANGQVRIENETKDLRDINWKSFRKEVQYVFQDPYSSLNPSRRVLSQLCDPFLHNKLGTRKEAEEKAKSLLQEVGLREADAKKYPHEFSGGQRQRIVIARALMLSPKLLICDECVSALDLSVQAKVLNLLKRLQIKYGLSILFISHDKDVIEYFCDEVIEI
ncbi:MAG: ABC transporter ATP-binding protein [Luteibaculum sp.]